MFVKKNASDTHLLCQIARNYMTRNLSKSSGMRSVPRQARSQERVSQILAVAEQMFITEGYNATTTNAIAARAKVSIGSLYQFFPDKAAIVQALALRYTEELHFRFAELDSNSVNSLSLEAYVEMLTNTTLKFFTDRPGYHAIFMQTQGTIPELAEIEDAADARLIQDLSFSLAARSPALSAIDREAIAFVLVKAIGTLLWLSLSQDEHLRQKIVTETKRFTLNYLQSYFPKNS
jgi:AcrR family transcriptional regulator